MINQLSNLFSPYQGLLRPQQQFGDSFSPFANSQPPPAPADNQVDCDDEDYFAMLQPSCINFHHSCQISLNLDGRCSTTSSSSSLSHCQITWRLHQMLPVTPPFSSLPLLLTLLLTLSQTLQATHSSIRLLLPPTRTKRRTRGRTLRIPSPC